MKWFQVPGRPDRRVALLLLLFANAPLFAAAGAMIASLPVWSFPPIWLLLLLIGCVLGQTMLLAIWFSLSQDTLWFRLSLVIGTLAAFQTGLCLCEIWLKISIQYPRELDNWREAAVYLAGEWLRSMALGLSMVLAAYALLLPIRRMAGVSLGTGEPHGEQGSRWRQFRISEIMIYTVIVAAPLMLARLGAPDEPEAVVLICLTCFVPLLLAFAVLCAALARRRAWLWTAGAFALPFAMAAILTEAYAYLNPPGRFAPSPLYGFWPLETLIVAAAATICVNAFVLRWLGFRLQRETGETLAIESIVESAAREAGEGH
jgi:hypothetical protein